MVVSFIAGENFRPATGDWQTLSHNVVSSLLLDEMKEKGTSALFQLSF